MTSLSAAVRTLRARLMGDRSDRGGVAVIVALLLGTGVLLGMAALVVDVGTIYAEREQLQTGADAAAIRAGQLCAQDPTGCTAADLAGVVDDYARGNARDEAAAATVCVSDDPDCAGSSDGSLSDCIGDAPDADYVKVRTHTERDGSTVLPPVFAQAVLDGFRGAKVTACARVAWGPPARTTGLALTVSACAWHRYTGDGAAFSDTEREIPLYDVKTAASCAPTDPNPGGFRWLADAGADCRATVSADAGYEVATGDSRPDGCAAALTALLDSGKPVAVPVFDSVSGGGARATYTVQGFAAFVVTGWHLPGSNDPSRDPTSTCATGGNACVYGHFTQALLTGGGAIGGRDLGAHIVALVG